MFWSLSSLAAMHLQWLKQNKFAEERVKDYKVNYRRNRNFSEALIENWFSQELSQVLNSITNFQLTSGFRDSWSLCNCFPLNWGSALNSCKILSQEKCWSLCLAEDNKWFHSFISQRTLCCVLDLSQTIKLLKIMVEV